MAKIDLPAAFLQEIKDLLGDEVEYRKFLDSYTADRSYGLRRNPLKYSKELFEQKMPFTLSAVPWAEDGYFYQEEEKPGKSPYHETGAYYIQEPSAMAVVEILQPMPGEKVADLCAAPGGKSSQIAGKLMGSGLLVSNEYVSKRALILAQNMERMGVPNCILLNDSTENMAHYFPRYFDKVVVDAPCSGEGMFRKDCVAIENWSPENVRACAQRQLEILNHAAIMVKQGGVLVYSTCTFSEQEDEQVIAKFLNTHEEYEADQQLPLEQLALYGMCPGKIPGTLRLWPHKINGEGHFIAKLRKKDDAIQDDNQYGFTDDFRKNRKEHKNRNHGVGKEMVRVFEEFCQETLSETYMQEMGTQYELVWSQDKVYLEPKLTVDLSGLNVLRRGIYLGMVKKNRFQPSHTFAMSLSKDAVKNITEVEAVSFIRGESQNCKESLEGWCLALHQGLPLGWGKAKGGILKNHYPKGLRKNL